MSPRRAPPPAEAPEPAPLPPGARGEGLLRKYQELLAKHEALIQKLERRNQEHITTFRLSSWALETTASALALLREGVVLLANRRWHELSHHAPWQRLHQGRAEGPTLSTLRQVAEEELRSLGALGSTGPRVSRYQGQGGARTLEVRTELVGLVRGDKARMVLVMAHDITERARTERELEQARTTLTEQEHLRALGELSSGVAHDLNNTLNAMRLRLELLQQDEPFAALHRGHLDALVRIVTDAGTRLRRLQDFARQRPEPSAEQVQLAAIIQEAVEIARSDIEHRAAREGISVRIEVDLPPLPPLNGAEAELRYVFINLLLNARDAMPRGGTIRVHGTLGAGSVIITVEDEGTGILEEHLHSVFRPFFTTKGPQGTGLGLSMAYGVMARAGGSITAANRPQGGAVFTLTFPCQAPPPVASERPSASPEPPPPLEGRVLVVDDDPSSREATLLAIEAYGLGAEGVGSGPEAVARLKAGQRYDLVLCDIRLPGPDGWQVARKVRSLARGTPIYLMTGSEPTVPRKDPRLRSVDGLLIKPLALSRLQEVLAEATARGPKPRPNARRQRGPRSGKRRK